LNIRDPRLHDIYRVNLENGAVELDTENPGDVNSWAADNRMRVRVAQAVTPEGGMEFRAREDAQTPWRVLTRWGPDENFGGVAGFSPDDTKVWLLSSVDANA